MTHWITLASTIWVVGSFPLGMLTGTCIRRCINGLQQFEQTERERQLERLHAFDAETMAGFALADRRYRDRRAQGPWRSVKYGRFGTNSIHGEGF